MIETIRLSSGAAAGEAGAATANTDSAHGVVGRILSIGLEYADSPPATTDVVVATAGLNGPALTILTVSNNATDGWWHPRHKVDDETGADVTYDGTRVVRDAVAVADYLNVSIAQANATDSVTATIVYEAGR